MPGMLELVDVSPDFGLPSFFVGGRLSTRSAAGVQGNGLGFEADRNGSSQLYEDAANFLDFFVGSKQVFVAQKISKTELSGFKLGFAPSMKRAVLRPQLLG